MVLLQKRGLILGLFMTIFQYAFSAIDSISFKFEGDVISKFPILTHKLKDKIIDNILAKDIDIRLTDLSSSLFSEEQHRAINHFNGLKQLESFHKKIPKVQYYKGTSKQTKDRFDLMRYKMILKIEYNKDIQKMIDHILYDKKKFLNKSYALKDYYFPLIESLLDKYELPLELKYLAVIESGLNPLAHSHAGAKGIWQFIYSTGTSLGLKVSSYVDDRADPVKSTKAACSYIKKLYSIFKDWNLVMVAYNYGMGNLKKAMIRAGGSRDFWKIKPYLPKETQNYYRG